MSDVFSNFTQSSISGTSAAAPAQAKPVAAQKVEESIPKESEPDKLEISSAKEEPKEKKGPIRKVKDFISGIKKGWSNIVIYTKATVGGIFKGGVVGAAVFGGTGIVNKIRQHGAEKAGNTIKKLPNKVFAGIAAAGVLAVNLWKASLDASEKRSDIEHRWEGHKQ